MTKPIYKFVAKTDDIIYFSDNADHSFTNKTLALGSIDSISGFKNKTSDLIFKGK